MPSDPELVARVIASDERAAFAELVRRHQSAVRGLLRKLTCGDWARADDLAQETFLLAYRRIASVRDAKHFRAWLCRIAYRTFVNSCRKRGEKPAPPEALRDLGEHQDGAPDASDGQRLDVERALGVLSTRERAVIVLSYGEGATHEEIAQMLETPLGTVKSDLVRAREKLFRRLSATTGGSA